MKIKQEHYNFMKQAIAPNAPKIAAHRQFIVNEGKSKDVDMRLRWDLLYYANLNPWACRNLYPYLNDTHIDTALKSIVKELTA